MRPCTNIPSDNVIELSSSSSSSDSCTNDENTLSCADSQKQLVLYEPSINEENQIETIPHLSPYKPQSSLPRVLPSVGTFTAQCANCFKWRLIPNQEKYQEIREHITEKPFVCETALEWRADVSCDDPADIEQDGSRLWAIDKPDIAQPPPGWQRLLRIRGEGCSKFADVYYTTPTGLTLRSIPDVEKYLDKHPEYTEQGVSISQFSFQIPKPLQEDYVRKRSARVPPLQDGNYMGKKKALVGPDDLRLELAVYPVVKKARSAPGKRIHNFDLMFRNRDNY